MLEKKFEVELGIDTYQTLNRKIVDKDENYLVQKLDEYRDGVVSKELYTQLFYETAKVIGIEKFIIC